MKKIILELIIVFLSLSVYSQKVFMYGENGEKVYFQEIDSLVQIKLKKNISNNEQLNILKTINSDVDISFSKNNRLVIPAKNGKYPNYIDLNKNASVIYANQSLMDDEGIIQIPTDKVLVKIKNDNKLGEILEELDIDYETYKNFGHDKNSYLIILKNGESLNTANTLYESGYFKYAQPSFTRFIEMMNANYPDQWGLNNTGQNGGTVGIDINAPEAWGITTGCEEIVVAVIDQGVDLDHPDLAGNLLTGYDATDGGSGGTNGDCWGDDAHGTCCAGIVGAIDNTIGTIGVAPDCSILPIRVSYELSGIEIWDDDWVIDAINYAWEVAGADILSCSWHYTNVTAISNEISDALNYGRNNLGCVVVFAAGNNNSSVSYPANNNSDIIAVGAMSPCGERKRSSSNWWEVNYGVSTDPNGVSCDNETWWGSNYGNELDLVAPGVFIPTTDLQDTAGYNNDLATDGDYYLTFNGTSAATPHVSGVAALILSVNPDLTQDEVRDIIESTCTKVGGYSYSTTTGRTNGTWDDEVGYGCVNARAALDEVVDQMNLSISGYSIVCSSNAYSVSNLPSGATVEWSLSPHPSPIQLQENIPSTNQCLVSNPYRYPAVMTLTAEITTDCGANIIITKTIASDTNTSYQTGSYYQQACSAYNNSFPSQSGTLNGSSVFLYPGCMTEVSLSQMTGRTVTLAPSSGQPLFWTYQSSNNKLYLQLPNNLGGIPFVFYITGEGACTPTKTLVFFAYSGYSLLFTPNPTSGETTVSIEKEEAEAIGIESASYELSFDENAEWDLEVYNNLQSLKLKKTKLKGSSTKIQTASWKEGIYMVRVKYKDEILTGKLVVKK